MMDTESILVAHTTFIAIDAQAAGHLSFRRRQVVHDAPVTLFADGKVRDE
jgi:hypothetical protein